MTHSGRNGDPNEPELLREDRDRLRRELGQTVTELTDKFDVRARTEEKVHDVAESGRHRAREAKHGALETADHARERAHELLVRAESAAPAPVVDRTRQLADATRTRPVWILAGGASAAVLGWLIVRRLVPQRRAAAAQRARGSASTRRRHEAKRRSGWQAAEHRHTRGRGRAIAGRTVKPIGRAVLMTRATTPLGAGTLLAAGARRASAKRRVDAEQGRRGRAAKRTARRAAGGG